MLELAFKGGRGYGYWLGFLALMIAAAVLLVIPAARNRLGILSAACVMVFIGTWIDKGLGLIAGGFIPSPLHQMSEYVPTGPELVISIGVHGIGGFLLSMLLKIAVGAKREVAAG
jgi:Ni/Fe-hydrogenase subunit HybB-like protein